MNNNQKPILSGSFNGVGWRSLTSVAEMKNNVLLHMLSKHNHVRLQQGMEPITLKKFITPRYWSGAKRFIENIKPLDLYKIRSKYANHKIVR